MQIQRRQFLKGAAGITATTMMKLYASPSWADNYGSMGLTAGDLEGNLNLLNNWGQQSDTVQELYTAAYNILAANRNATFADVAADAEIQTICDQNGIIHLGGPTLGDVTQNGAKIWIRTFRPAAVKVNVTIDNEIRVFGPVNSTSETDMAAIVPVTGLEPATSYPYSVLVNDIPISIPAHAAITTAPTDATGGAVRIAFGTCPHRWGLGNPQQSAQIRSRNPVAMLLGGDVSAQDRNNHCGLHRADYLVRDFYQAWRDLAARIPVFATWDDHDYFDNDKAGIPNGYTDADRQNVSNVFRGAWNNPSYGNPDSGVYFRTRIGPCDVIMIDNRYFRTSKGQENAFLGADQMNWLKTQLLDCKGPFIILSCGTMWSDYVSNAKDSWGVWDAAGREQIFNLIEEENIPGVLLISGDRHGARGFRIPRPSGYNFYEFEAGSLGGRSGPPVTDPSWDTQLYGISGRYAFGEFSINAELPDPQVTFRLIEEDGNIIYQLTLTRSMLTPQPPKGDVNKDGKVNIGDLKIMSNEFLDNGIRP